MNRRTCIFLIPVFLQFFSCNSLKIKSSELAGRSAVTMDNNFILHDWFHPLGGLEVNAQKFQTGADEVRYQIVVHYSFLGRSMHIKPGPSLVFLADGQRITLLGGGSSGPGGRRWVYYNGTLNELAIYEISRGDLDRIAFALHVRMLLRGDLRSIREDFSGDNIENFRKFLEAPLK